ncbi:hypothetical protein IAE22_33090, partial [Bacillus sp. S34]|nr:hypothetical protein [Bacillus sp. S34]
MTDATDLRIAVNRLSRTLRAQKADSTVSDAQFSALARLHRDGPMTLAELGIPPLEDLRETMRLVQAAEATAAHGPWIAAHPGALSTVV